MTIKCENFKNIVDRVKTQRCFHLFPLYFLCFVNPQAVVFFTRVISMKSAVKNLHRAVAGVWQDLPLFLFSPFYSHFCVFYLAF